MCAICGCRLRLRFFASLPQKIACSCDFNGYNSRSSDIYLVFILFIWAYLVLKFSKFNVECYFYIIKIVIRLEECVIPTTTYLCKTGGLAGTHFSLWQIEIVNFIYKIKHYRYVQYKIIAGH